MKILGREPALIIGAIGAVLTALADHVPGLSTGQAAALTAFVASVLIAATTRPVAPAVFTAVVAAGFALVAEYGMHVSDDVVSKVTAALLAILVLLGVRPQVSPTEPGAQPVVERPVFDR